MKNKSKNKVIIYKWTDEEKKFCFNRVFKKWLYLTRSENIIGTILKEDNVIMVCSEKEELKIFSIDHITFLCIASSDFVTFSYP
jgi:hypothetical protein